MGGPGRRVPGSPEDGNCGIKVETEIQQYSNRAILLCFKHEDDD
jgi:hypothetical protein